MKLEWYTRLPGMEKESDKQYFVALVSHKGKLRLGLLLLHTPEVGEIIEKAILLRVAKGGLPVGKKQLGTLCGAYMLWKSLLQSNGQEIPEEICQLIEAHLAAEQL